MTKITETANEDKSNIIDKSDAERAPVSLEGLLDASKRARSELMNLDLSDPKQVGTAINNARAELDTIVEALTKATAK